MGSSTDRRPVCLAIVLTALALLVGCDRQVEVRSYREVMVSPSPVGALFDSTGGENGSGSRNESWRWVAPAEWNELPGGGESTVVVLEGDAGGAEANVQRWLKQLGLDLPPERMRALLDDAVSVRADLNFTLFDFTAVVASQDHQAFLTAIASVGGQTMFVKAEAPAGVLMEQRSAFVAFLNSLGPRSAGGGYGKQG